MKIIQSFILMKLFFLYIGQARDKKSIKNEITFIITNIKVTLLSPNIILLLMIEEKYVLNNSLNAYL